MPLLTDTQLAAWKQRVHEEYVEANRKLDHAVYREKLWRRYVRRHYNQQANTQDGTHSPV